MDTCECGNNFEAETMEKLDMACTESFDFYRCNTCGVMLSVNTVSDDAKIERLAEYEKREINHFIALLNK